MYSQPYYGPSWTNATMQKKNPYLEFSFNSAVLLLNQLGLEPDLRDSVQSWPCKNYCEQRLICHLFSQGIKY